METRTLAQNPNFDSNFDSSKLVWFQNLDTEQPDQFQTSETEHNDQFLKIRNRSCIRFLMFETDGFVWFPYIRN